MEKKAEIMESGAFAGVASSALRVFIGGQRKFNKKLP